MKPFDPDNPLDQRRWAREVAMVVDPLLADVWSFAWACEETPAEDDPEDAPFAVLLRMAYLQGYGDALEEGERGEVFQRLGVEIPSVKKPRPVSRTRRARRPSGSSGS